MVFFLIEKKCRKKMENMNGEEIGKRLKYKEEREREREKAKGEGKRRKWGRRGRGGTETNKREGRTPS